MHVLVVILSFKFPLEIFRNSAYLDFNPKRSFCGVADNSTYFFYHPSYCRPRSVRRMWGTPRPLPRPPSPCLPLYLSVFYVCVTTSHSVGSQRRGWWRLSRLDSKTNTLVLRSGGARIGVGGKQTGAWRNDALQGRQKERLTNRRSGTDGLIDALLGTGTAIQWPRPKTVEKYIWMFILYRYFASISRDWEEFDFSGTAFWKCKGIFFFAEIYQFVN